MMGAPPVVRIPELKSLRGGVLLVFAPAADPVIRMEIGGNVRRTNTDSHSELAVRVLKKLALRQRGLTRV
jgi:hypothetical protein